MLESWEKVVSIVWIVVLRILICAVYIFIITTLWALRHKDIGAKSKYYHEYYIYLVEELPQIDSPCILKYLMTLLSLMTAFQHEGLLNLQNLAKK